MSHVYLTLPGLHCFAVSCNVCSAKGSGAISHKVPTRCDWLREQKQKSCKRLLRRNRERSEQTQARQSTDNVMNELTARPSQATTVGAELRGRVESHKVIRVHPEGIKRERGHGAYAPMKATNCVHWSDSVCTAEKAEDTAVLAVSQIVTSSWLEPALSLCGRRRLAVPAAVRLRAPPVGRRCA